MIRRPKGGESVGPPSVVCPPEDRAAFTKEMEREISILTSGRPLTMIGRKPNDTLVTCSQCGKGCWVDAPRRDILRTQKDALAWCWFCILAALKARPSYIAVTTVSEQPPPFMREGWGGA